MTAGMGRPRKALCAVLILVLCAAVIAVTAAVKMPKASGKTVKKNGKITVDCSNMSEGYIMVKAKKSSKRYKVQITADKEKPLNYDLNSSGEYEAFPLQYGSRKYQIALYENVSGNKYSQEGSVKLSVKMKDELSCFLYPNQYVSYTSDTACVKYAQELCKGMKNQSDIYKAVCKYVSGNFLYDYVKSLTVKPGTMPEIDECWKKKMGICQDLSAVTCAMLRSLGVPARLMIGTADTTYHAWVVANVNGKDVFYDPTAEVGAGSKTATYTTERYY